MSRRIMRRGRSLAASPWTPLSPGNLKFWVKADTGVTTLGDASPTTPYTSWTVSDLTITGGQTDWDGSTNAYSLTDNTNNVWHYSQAAMTYTAGSLYKIEVYAKYVSVRYLVLAFDSLLAWFDIQNGALGGVSGSVTHRTIVSLGNGWYKCTMYAYAGSTNAYISPATADAATTTYAGTGSVACYVSNISITRQAVSAWADQSQTGDSNKNLAQSTGTAKPGLIVADSGYNYSSVLTFDSGDYMQSGTWLASQAQPCTHYFVGSAAINGAADPLATDGIDASNRQSISGLIGTGKWTTYAGSAAVTAPTTTTTAKHVVCAFFAGVSSATYIDNYTTAEVAGNPGSHALTGVTVGARYSGSNQWAGKIAELLIYSGLHDAATRALVMQYLGNKYSITITG